MVIQGRSQDFSKGESQSYVKQGHHPGIADYTYPIYGLYRRSPSCISGLSRIIAAWRPILTKDKNRWRKYFTKKQILNKWAFQQWLLRPRWRFRHLHIVGCLLKRRPTKGGSEAIIKLSLLRLTRKLEPVGNNLKIRLWDRLRETGPRKGTFYWHLNQFLLYSTYTVVSTRFHLKSQRGVGSRKINQ